MIVPVPPSVCPGCGYRPDRAAPLTEGPAEPQLPGDLTLCFNCGLILIYGYDLQLSDGTDHILDLMGDELTHMLCAQEHVLKRGLIQPKVKP